MNVRFGIIFLVVAIVFAIDQVRSEEAEAETMVRREAGAAGLEEMHGESKRSPDPMKKLLEEIKKRLGRSADPGKVSVKDLMKLIKARKGRKAERSASADPDPDPGMLDFLKNIPFIGGLMR